MKVTITCDCGEVYVRGESESFGEGLLPGVYTSASCSRCRPWVTAKRLSASLAEQTEESRERWEQIQNEPSAVVTMAERD